MQIHERERWTADYAKYAGGSDIDSKRAQRPACCTPSGLSHVAAPLLAGNLAEAGKHAGDPARFDPLTDPVYQPPRARGAPAKLARGWPACRYV